MTTALVILALLVPGSGPLRYRFTPGESHVIASTEETTTSVQVGNAKPQITRQTLQLKTQTRVIAFAGGEAVLEEQRIEGHSESESDRRKIESVLPPSLREIHITPQGKIVKIERKPLAGVRDSGPAFLEGFSVPLPEKAIQPKAAWGGASTGTGFDGRPVTVRYNARYVNDELHKGRRCARFESALDASFEVAGQGGQKSVGTLKGKLTSWFDPDAGVDAEIESQIEITVKSGAGAAQQTVIMKSHGNQVLTK